MALRDTGNELDVGDSDIKELCKSFSKHNEYLKGIHINCQNSQVGTEGVDCLIESIASCQNLASLGFDFGDLKVEGNQMKRLNEVIREREGILSLAIGFHKAQNMDNEIISDFIDTVEKKLGVLKMLRINFANTDISKNNLVRLNQVLRGSKISHLELFLGGNSSLDNNLAGEFAETIRDLSLTGFEFDAGYSSCNGKFLYGFDFDTKELTRCAFYLNG